ncbi:hypothetical protein [Pseudalkalibacillus salsuginis]|uniref:hypothetical protein n=1 Tax=Pseudalkalibacillus salsuginis TaxID=2910972 RepID=UPI001F2B48C3|nr:hypothetical protein [Pseudalkalibacillus salsuginis]MCF6411600.1 hypothetical protein [Pseudalkalibacillus salsuginis]
MINKVPDSEAIRCLALFVNADVSRGLKVYLAPIQSPCPAWVSFWCLAPMMNTDKNDAENSLFLLCSPSLYGQEKWIKTV